MGKRKASPQYFGAYMKDYPTEIILSKVFDVESSIYPLIIFPSPFYPEDQNILHYYGVHFQETASILNIIDEEAKYILAGFDKNGEDITSSGKQPKIIFDSIEIKEWAMAIVSGSLFELLKCTEIPTFMDQQFDEFITIASTHHNFKLLQAHKDIYCASRQRFLEQNSLVASYNKEVEQKLNTALLNLRRNLF